MKVKVWAYNKEDMIFNNVKGVLLTLTGDLIITFNSPIEKTFSKNEYNGFYVLE